MKCDVCSQEVGNSEERRSTRSWRICGRGQPREPGPARRYAGRVSGHRGRSAELKVTFASELARNTATGPNSKRSPGLIGMRLRAERQMDRQKG